MFHFATAVNLLGLSNTHTKCKETLLVFKCKCTHKFHRNMGTWVMIVTKVPHLECAVLAMNWGCDVAPDAVLPLVINLLTTTFAHQ